MYKRSIEGWAKHWDFILLDTICLQISFILAYFLRYKKYLPYSVRNPYRTSALVLFLLSVVIAILFNTMHNVISRSIWEEIKRTVLQCAVVFGGIVLLLFSDKSSNRVSRIVLYLAMILYAVTAFVTRQIYKRILITHKKSVTNRVILLVGDGEGVAKARRAFEDHPEEGISICATVRVDGDGDVELYNAAEYIRNEWIDEVYIAVTDVSLIPTDLINTCSEMAVTVHQQIFIDEGLNDHPWIEKIAKQPVLTTSINIPHPAQLFVKRLVDIIAGLFLSIGSIVVIIIATPLIKLSSSGPVLLSFERIGQNGRKYKMYMIRTMYMDAVNRDDSSRFIKGIGSFLHRWSLDQLPKGFNVLAGSMSLVGTRAPSIEEWDRYQYHHRARLACKPGITGLWVVCCKNKDGSNLSFEEATVIDTEYITNWTFGLDLKILFAPAVLRKQYEDRKTLEGRS